MLHILPLGVSHPVTADLFVAARDALRDVIECNEKLFDELDVDQFFHCVRPYYKPHRVGLNEHRGANAGDFAGINVIDLLLGLCRADDAYYSQLPVDKFLFMRPEEQLILRDCMRQRSLIDVLLEQVEASADCDWFHTNTKLFLEVCEAHGQTAVQHHEKLVKRFIEDPAFNKGLTDKPNLTASGPPLPVLLSALKNLSDLRSAADKGDGSSRYKDIQRLKAAVGYD